MPDFCSSSAARMPSQVAASLTRMRSRLIWRLGIVLDDLLGAGDRGGGVEREVGVDFGRDAPGDELGQRGADRDGEAVGDGGDACLGARRPAGRPRRWPRSSCPRTRAFRAPSARSRGWSCSRRASAVARPRCRRCRRPRWSSRAADRVWTSWSSCLREIDVKQAGGERARPSKALPPDLRVCLQHRCAGRPSHQPEAGGAKGRQLAIPRVPAKMRQTAKLGATGADQEDHQ